MSIEWEGMDEFQAALHKFPEVATKSVKASLYQGAEAIMTDSKQKYVPVDLGTLKSSGHVKQPKSKGSKITVELGYGGAASAYALYQHEVMALNHTVGGPKYLERPVNSAKKKVSKAIGQNLDKAIRKVM